MQYGFSQPHDHSLFIYHLSNVLYYFLVYVDNLILKWNNTTFIHHFYSSLGSQFSLKDSTPLHLFLRIDILWISIGIFLSQHHYTQKMFAEHHMASAKLVQTPITISLSLTKVFLTQMLLLIKKWLGHHSILLGLVLILHLLSISYRNSCNVLLCLIGMLLNGYCDIWNAQLLMVFI